MPWFIFSALYTDPNSSVMMTESSPRAQYHIAVSNFKMKSAGKRNADNCLSSSKKRRYWDLNVNNEWNNFLHGINPAALETDLYVAAACVMEKVSTKTASVRTAVYGASYGLKKPLMALATKCIAKLDVVDEIIKAFSSRTDAAKNQLPLLPKTLQQILVYDICFGQPSRVNQYYRRVKPHEAALKSVCADVLLHENSRTTNSHQRLPRYVRINQLVVHKRNDVINKLVSDDKFELVETPTTWSSFCKAVQSLEPMQFMRDFHMNRSLLVFHPSVQFHLHHLLTSGAIVLQDKASCLAGLLLRPARDSVVIDACAAPGMKTSMLAASMHNTGRIYAVDRDENRTQIMLQLLNTCRAINVDAACRDFTRCDPHSAPFVDAEYILVDPSCSGSGIVARDGATDYADANSEKLYDRARLLKLQSFQVMMLRHALSFPNVKRIVYSTCSVFEEENERVIEQALYNTDATEQFVLQDLGNYWAASGEKFDTAMESQPESNDAVYDDIRAKCLRLAPDTHLTNGFFIAVLERKPDLSKDP